MLGLADTEMYLHLVGMMLGTDAHCDSSLQINM